MMNLFSQKNKRLVSYLAFFFIWSNFYSQSTYFQQRVDYLIRVKLNDTAHSLSAFESLNYVNNSSVELTELYFHLWPNAYKNKSTALAKQLVLNGKTDFFYSTEAERGFIDSLDFKVNGKKVKWYYDSTHIDICRLILNDALSPGDSIQITTPFYVKIPDAKFSRLGHTEQAYYITQWYPKPAVFDNKGWHAMPYLNQGEFYSEFGSFDVSITLPENYVLAASGDRIEANEEEKFIGQRVAESELHLKNNSAFEFNSDFPKSSSKLKTIRFKQTKVHDFAWFADKRFYVLHNKLKLEETNQEVDTWIYFLHKNRQLWKDALPYVNDATKFYSSKLGAYPYNQVSAVDGNIAAGGGMEYPNITVIGEAGTAIELDMVITHEVGHNWFYGILANNERESPFMDEGLNSFYETRYLRAKYPNQSLAAFIGRNASFKLFGLSKIPFWKYHQISYYPSLRSHSDQAVLLPAIEFTETNYGACVYSKSAVVMDYLMEYMGETNFDKAMKIYYEAFKFKHPNANDLFKSLNQSSGLDLSRIQYHLFASTDKIDFKLKKVKKQSDGSYKLIVKNKTGVLVPFNISALKENEIVSTNWFDAFDKKRTLTIPPGDFDKLKIDGNEMLPDIGRSNNNIHTKGIFKHRKPAELNFMTRFEDPDKHTFNYLPVFGGNFYNGAELGIAVHNIGFYQKKFEYVLAPMFAFNTRSLVGFASANFNFYPKASFQQIELGAKIKSFAYDYFNTNTLNSNHGTSFSTMYLNYYKVAPYIAFEFKKRNAHSQLTQHLKYTMNHLFVDSVDYSQYNSFSTNGPVKKNTYSFVNQLSYQISNKRAIDPYSLSIELQHTARMAKVSATFHYQWFINKKNTVELRVFAGTFFSGDLSERSYYAFRGSGYNGWHDYLFDVNYAARNERNGFGFTQFTEKDGALNVWTPLAQSPYWLTSFNIKSPKIFKLPLKVFADIVACDGRSLNEDIVLWDAGINVALWKNVIDIYVPLLYSKDIKNTLDLNQVDFIHSIRFTFNIHKLDPKNIIQTSLF